MKITGAVVTAISQPRGYSLKTSYGSRDDATTVVVQLQTDEGLVGIGQTAVDAPFYGETAEGIVHNTRAHLVPAVSGESPLNIEGLVKKLQAALPSHWSSHAGVELALWDLKGKALGVPVYQLLGGKVREGVDMMGFVDVDEPDVMARQADAVVNEKAYGVLKMKIGMDPEGDVRRYRAVAEAVEGRAVIQVDGNAGYQLGEAIPALTRMEQAGALGAIEQPVARISDMAEIARRLAAPVMADEAIYGPADAYEVMRQRAAAIALMKITKHGGILNVQKIAAILESAGAVIGVALYYDIINAAAAHIAAALPVVRWPSPGGAMPTSILTQPLPFEDQIFRVPEGPGFGVELNPDALAEFALDL